MRIAAGILMVIFGMTTMGIFVGFMSENGISVWPLAYELSIIISAVFIITGGVFCLRRKYWKLCFASSLFLLLFMIFKLYFLPPFEIWFNIFLFLPMGILPLIFVCLRKSEWQEIQG